MSKAELYRRYADVIEMAEKVSVEPIKCVRFYGVTKSVPDFLSDDTDGYEFAIGIVEGKPVFIGDVLYRKDDGERFFVQNNPSYLNGYEYNLTWTKPFDALTELKAEIEK